MKKVLYIISIALSFAIQAFPQCACCSSVGCGDNSGSGPTVIKQGKWLFGFAGRYTSFKPITKGQLQQYAANDTLFPVYNKSYQLTYTASLTYGITNRLNVTAILPYNSITNIQVGAPGDIIVQGTSKGLSNIKASVQYMVLQRRYCKGWELIPSVGIIAPTGIHSNVGLDGTVFDDQFQPGANAWVPVLGLSANNVFHKSTFRSSFNYVFASADPQGNVDAALWNMDASIYHMLFKAHGNELKQTTDSSKTIILLKPESSFMMIGFAGIQLEHIGQDIVVVGNGSKVSNINTGALRTYANLGIAINLYHRIFIPLSFALPVYQTFNGYQVSVKWRLNMGISTVL